MRKKQCTACNGTTQHHQWDGSMGQCCICKGTGELCAQCGGDGDQCTCDFQRLERLMPIAIDMAEYVEKVFVRRNGETPSWLECTCCLMGVDTDGHQYAVVPHDEQCPVKRASDFLKEARGCQQSP